MTATSQLARFVSGFRAIERLHLYYLSTLHLIHLPLTTKPFVTLPLATLNFSVLTGSISAFAPILTRSTSRLEALWIKDSTVGTDDDGDELLDNTVQDMVMRPIRSLLPSAAGSSSLLSVSLYLQEIHISALLREYYSSHPSLPILMTRRFAYYQQPRSISSLFAISRPCSFQHFYARNRRRHQRQTSLPYQRFWVASRRHIWPISSSTYSIARGQIPVNFLPSLAFDRRGLPLTPP